MATVVDSLVVTIGLDPSQFTKGRAQVEIELQKTKSAALSTGKEMQAAGQKAGEFFSQVKTEALGLIGVLVGSAGLGAFIKDTTVNLAALGRAATNIGVGARDLSAFQMMIERNGGSAQAATSSLLGYANAIERFRVFGDTSILAFLNPIGASVNDDPLAVIAKFQKYIEENINKPGGAQLINLEGRGLGYDQDLINSLIQIRTLANEQRELAKSYELGTPTAEQIKRAQELQESWFGLRQAATNLGRAIESDLEPQMKSVLDWYTGLIEKRPAVATGLAVVAGYLITIAGLNFGAVMAFLGAWAPFIALGTGAAYVGAHTASDAFERMLKGETPSGFDEYGVPFFSDGAGKGLLPAHPVPTPSATGDPDQQGSRQQIIDYFLGRQGRTQAQAAAIADVVGYETGGTYNASSFNPAGGGRCARGLMNWRGDRIDMYRRMYGHDPDAGSFAENMDFINWELTHSEVGAGRLLRMTQTEQQGVGILNQYYTRPGVPYGTQVPVAPGLARGPRVGASSTTTVQVGTVNVHTQAADAPGIAREMNQAIIDNWMVQGGRGLQ